MKKRCLTGWLLISITCILLFVMLTVMAECAIADEAAQASAEKPAAAQSLTITPIGKVVVKDGRTFIVLEEKYAPGLLGLDEYSHLNVFWWFSNNDTPQKRGILQVHPRGNRDNPLTGVFATRSPMRPNLIALTRCKIVKVEKNRIEIDKIDAFDGTPVIDLKPYIPGYDSLPDDGDREVKLPKWTGHSPPKTEPAKPADPTSPQPKK